MHPWPEEKSLVKHTGVLYHRPQVAVHHCCRGDLLMEEVEAIYVQSSVPRKLRRICVNESLVVIRVLGESLVLKEFPTRIPLVPLECS